MMCKYPNALGVLYCLLWNGERDRGNDGKCSGGMMDECERDADTNVGRKKMLSRKITCSNACCRANCESQMFVRRVKCLTSTVLRGKMLIFHVSGSVTIVIYIYIYIRWSRT